MTFEIWFKDEKQNTVGPTGAGTLGNEKSAQKIADKKNKLNKYPTEFYYVVPYQHYRSCYP